MLLVQNLDELKANTAGSPNDDEDLANRLAETKCRQRGFELYMLGQVV